jgi:hypothetical protein
MAAGLRARDPLVVVSMAGQFSAQDTAVAGILRVLACAVPAWVAQQIAVRAFFARGDTWRPMLLGRRSPRPRYLAFGNRRRRHRCGGALGMGPTPGDLAGPAARAPASAARLSGCARLASAPPPRAGSARG